MKKTTKVSKPLEINDEQAEAARALIENLRNAVDHLERLLTGRSNVVQPTPGEREVMKPGEYADRMRVTVDMVHAWVKKGMPHFQIEGRVRLRVAEADAWLLKNRDAEGK